MLIQAIIDFIRGYPYKYPPTVHEIATGMGHKSSTMVHGNLAGLIKLGLLERRAIYNGWLFFIYQK